MRKHELAAELRELAADPRLAAREAELSDLAHAITDSDEAERWCEVDLFAAFSPENSIVPSGEPAETQRKKTFRWFRILMSSSLIFAPILITWWGLKEATGAYGEVLQANGSEAAQRPFLEMWQQGFDGRLNGFFEFDNIALCTICAIFLLIFWTVFENVTRNSAEREDNTSERDLALLRARLRRALTRASLLLGQVRLSSPARFGAELTRTASEINLVGETVRKAQTELVDTLTLTWKATQQTTELLTGGAADVREAMAALGTHVANIDIACDDMAAAVGQVSEMIEALGSTTGLAVTSVGERLSTTISQTTLDMRQAFADELERSTRSVQSTVSTLDLRVGELGEAAVSMRHGFDDGLLRSVDAVQGTVTGLDDRIEELVKVTASIGYAVDRAAVAIDSVGSSTERAVSRIGDEVTDSFTTTAVELRRTFGDTGAEIRGALGDWSDTAGAHASRIEMVSDTSGRTVSLLEQTRDTLDRLPVAIAGVLAELPARMRELSDDEFAGLKGAIVELRDSMEHAAVLLTPAVPGRADRADRSQETLW
ncbi:hypothetical protein [Streptosporangium sp. OZ121]|uniref:hypothetical protein n=1 Tax=Streptosporangium sp. OZ121 TaxID=3444183 RepID=UPI003F7AE299